MQHQHRATVWLTAVVALAVVLATSVRAQSTKTSSAVAALKSCPSVANGVLTTECDGACSSYQPCIAASVASTSTGCQCFTINASAPSSYKNWTLLIPFDSNTNASLKNAGTAPYDVAAGTWDLNVVPWASNDVVAKIAPLSLPSTTTNVTIRGGDSIDACRKNVMATVSIDPTFLAKTQVTTLVLENINLAATIDPIVTNLPSTMKELSIRNTGLKAFPLSVKSLKRLETLYIDFTNVDQVTPDHALPQLKALTLFGNKIKTFTAIYPKLTYMDLGGNMLASVPKVVANHSMLEILYLTDNSITTFDVSSVPSSITQLQLSNNTLSAFDAYLPRLTLLDLSGNQLTAFPQVIYSLANLQLLFMDNNDKLQNVTFTNEQASFLNSLLYFSIARSNVETNCAEDQKFWLKRPGTSVCISNGKNLAIIEGPRTVAPAPAPTLGSTRTRSKSLTAPIAGGSAGVLLLLVVAVIVVVRRRRKAAGKTKTNVIPTRNSFDTTVQGIHHVNNGDVSLWQDTQLRSIKVDSDDIEDIRKLGSGAFADVWLVKFRGAEFLASKRLRKSEVTPDATQKFIDEIKLVATLSHPRVVELKGVAWIRELDLQALFEYMECGDLRMYLMSPNVPMQWSAETLQIAIDVIEALVYVHSFAPPLVHRDLKSRNVLLSNSDDSNDGCRSSYSGVRAKLTDFGVSRYRSEQRTMTAGVGTGRWLAPEVISGCDDYGPAADIFSFGVVLSELDSHELPYADVRTTNGKPLPDVALLQRVAIGALVPSMSASCPPKVVELMRLCCALQPEDRPNAPEVAYALRRLQKESHRSEH